MKKSKKLLALLTALSISASAFAGLCVPAFAEGEATDSPAAWTAPQYPASGAVHSNSAVSTTDRTVKIGGQEYTVKALGSISGGIENAVPGEYNEQPGGTASFKVNVDTAGAYNVKVTGLGARKDRRTDIQVGETVYPFPDATEGDDANGAYGAYWTVISDSDSGKEVFTYTAENIALAEGENTITIGTKIDSIWGPDLVGIDVESNTPAGPGIAYKNGKVIITSETAQTGLKLIVAKYYDNNTLNSVDIQDVDVIEGTKEVELNLNGSAATIMLWKALNGEGAMVPVFDSVCKVTGEIQAAPTAKPTATPIPGTEPTPQPTIEPTEAPTPKPTIDPALIYYKLDFEDTEKTYLFPFAGNTGSDKNGITSGATDLEQWSAQYYYGGMKVDTDKNASINKYFRYLNDKGSGTRATFIRLPEAAAELENNQSVIEFDFKINKKGGQIAFTGDTGTPIGNDYYETTNKPAGKAPIVKITMGENAQFVVNNSATATSKGYTADTWAHAKAVINFETRAVILTVTSLDGSTTYFDTAQVSMGEGDDATKLSQIFMAGPRYSGGAAIDNVIVRKVASGDIGATYYTVTLNVDGTETRVGVKEGEKLTQLPDTAKTGYIFDGWKVGENADLLSNDQLLDMAITEDVNITAEYSKDPEYIEPMVGLEFSEFPAGGIPTAGADENTAESNPITVKIIGEIGGNLTENPDPRVKDLDVKWEFLGFRHIASKAMAGENSATDDGGPNKYCDSYAEVVPGEKATSVDFQLKGQAFNFYGAVKATVTYNGETKTIIKPMSILPDKTTDATTILPKAGYKYVQDVNNYSDDMVGYQLTTSNGNKEATDITSGDWAAYGGNSGRGLYIAKDEDTNKKFYKLKSTGTNSSSFAVNKLDAAPTGQVIIKQDVKFYNSGSSILFKQDNPVTWSANATSLSFDFNGSGFIINGSDKICDASAGKWYTIVLAADVTSKLASAKVYDKETNELLGSSDIRPFVNAGSAAPVYLCYRTPDNSQGELDFNNVNMYVPSIDESKFTIKAADETLSIPKAGAADVTTTINATALSTEGYDMIGKAEWTFDSTVSDTSSLVITPDTTNSHNAVLTVKAGAPAGELPINVTIGGVTKQVKINLTSSQDSVQFTKSTSSISIPLEEGASGDYEYAAKVVGPTSEEDDTPIDIPGKTVTLAVYDKNNANELTTLPAGITFDAATGKLTVTSEASATTLYIRATSTNRKDEPITKALKVTIHGLAFDFGAGTDDDLVEGYTAVTPSTQYNDAAGYGIENGTPTVGGTASADNADSDNLTGTFTFKAKVQPNKVYKVKINYSGKVVSEKVNVDLTGVERSNATQGTVEYQIPVIGTDGILDLTFSGGNVASIIIEKTPDKAANFKPHIYTVGDSTIANSGSWAYVMARDYASYSQLSEKASFSNNGRGGKNLASYYTGGELVDRVLVNICPDDYVMIGDMGTNGMGSKFEESFNYYVDACEALGAKIILNSYTPHGVVSGYESGYDAATNTFNSCRQDDYDKIVRKIYEERTTAGGEKYDDKIVGFVDIGKMADAAFNAYVADYAKNGHADKNAAAQAIIACFSDHNHYSKAPLAAELMINGYGDGADAKGIVKSLYEIISADLAK